MSVRDIVKPLVQKGLSGIIIAFGIYGLFMFASYVTNYLWLSLTHCHIINLQNLLHKASFFWILFGCLRDDWCDGSCQFNCIRQVNKFVWTVSVSIRTNCSTDKNATIWPSFWQGSNNWYSSSLRVGIWLYSINIFYWCLNCILKPRFIGFWIPSFSDSKILNWNTGIKWSVGGQKFLN